jgi:(p)ppGpp synthase/HD superfamily hydrolase
MTSSLEIKAVKFATNKHSTQKRSNGVPYITHPLRVMETVKHYTNDVDTICAAVLHDTLEDTETMYEEIEREFSPVIASYVKEITSDNDSIAKLMDIEYNAHLSNQSHETHGLVKRYLEKIPEIEPKSLRKRLGKSLYLARKLNNMTPNALLVKLSDRLDNVSDLAGISDQGKLEYALETEYILNSLSRDLTSDHMELITRIRNVIAPIIG